MTRTRKAWKISFTDDPGGHIEYAPTAAKAKGAVAYELMDCGWSDKEAFLRLRAYGNAIVPQVAATFISTVMESTHAA